MLARIRSLWHGLRRRGAVEAEMTEEFLDHLAHRTRDLVRTGLPREEAARRARLEFGHLDTHREAARTARGLHVVDELRFSWLDVRLGARMMLKHPGLTLIAGIGMAVAIAISTSFTSTMRVMTDSTLPLAEGDRIVALQNWDSRIDRRGATSPADLATWREEAKSLQDVGAYRSINRNLISADGTVEPLPMAEMSASGFEVAGVQPFLGRYLLPADELAGAPHVMVIAWDVWQRRFNGDRSVVGRELRLADETHIIVGVMPEGFAFPVNHNFWIPLRPESRGGVNAFGKLAPGVSLEQARAELDVIGRRIAAADSVTHGTLHAQVHPYTRPVTGMDQPGDLSSATVVSLLTTLLLVVISLNVAILIYARTAVRHGEIVVRTALGASRSRVITQLFAESLVLALLAAGAGVAFAAWGLDRANLILATTWGGQLPFWMDFRLSWPSVAFAVGLAVLAALITGVAPALKATGTQVRNSMQQLSAGGGSLRLGRTWTALIIGQVAVTVAVLPLAVFQGGEIFRLGVQDPGFAAGEYVAARLYLETGGEGSATASYDENVTALLGRLRAGSGNGGATLASAVPGKEQEAPVAIEQADSAAADRHHIVRLANVDPSFLQVVGVAPTMGRLFLDTEADTSSRAVIVNESFLRSYLSRDRALGRRIRQVSPDGTEAPGPWYEIVGVVPNFPKLMIPEQVEATVYRAVSPRAMYPATLLVRSPAASDPAFGVGLRREAAAVNRALQVRSVRRLSAVYEGDQSTFRLVALGIGAVMLSVLLLSAGGIYAMMSLAVTRRQREIAIRTALGASAGRILAAVLARATTQIGAGAAVGLLTTLVIDQFTLGGFFLKEPLILVTVAVILVIVGLFASMGPARRGLRIEPAEALKQE